MVLMAIVNSCACEKNYFALKISCFGDLWWRGFMERQKNVFTTGAFLHAEKKDKNKLLS